MKAKTIEEICGYENLMYSEKQVKGKCSEWKLNIVLYYFPSNLAAVQRKNDAWRRTWKMNDNEEIMLKKAEDKNTEPDDDK